VQLIAWEESSPQWRYFALSELLNLNTDKNYYRFLGQQILFSFVFSCRLIVLQETLGDIVYAQLPDVDTELEQFGKTYSCFSMTFCNSFLLTKQLQSMRFSFVVRGLWPGGPRADMWGLTA